MRSVMAVISVLLAVLVPFAARGAESPATPVPIELVFVKGGCFQMGDVFGDGAADERPAHEVCVDDFSLGRYEVTQGQWKAVMGGNPSSFQQGSEYPVEGVSWNDAQIFIRELNRRTGKTYRLPTEAEWEYAARSGGRKEKWAGANDSKDLDALSWNRANADTKSHAAGTKRPNGLGIHDMSGNLWEWVADWYSAEYYKKSPRQNPPGPARGKERVQRGGCWFNEDFYLRTMVRLHNPPDLRDYDIGFRVLLPAEKVRR